MKLVTFQKDVATSDTGYDLSQDTWLVREETVGPADYGNSLLTRVANRKIEIKPFTQTLQEEQHHSSCETLSSQTTLRTKKKQWKY